MWEQKLARCTTLESRKAKRGKEGEGNICGCRGGTTRLKLGVGTTMGALNTKEKTKFIF